MENNPVFVLLAGGKSERMGVDKGLLKYKHTFWILEQLQRISNSNISTVYIGLGYNFQNYFNAIPWFEKAKENSYKFQNLDIKVVLNKLPEKGSFSTLQKVLKNVSETNDVIINPIDTPILNATELNNIILKQNSVVTPSFEGKNGHPIKLNYKFWKHFCYLNLDDENARLDTQIKKTSPTKISNIEVFDRAIILNLNTKTAWINYLKNC